MFTNTVAAVTALFILFGAAESPLTVSHLVTGPNSHILLSNAGVQPVTAWSLETVTQGESGRTHHEVETVDGYLSEVTGGLPGASPRLERLLPGQSRELTLDPLPPDAVVHVIAVVLDDGTAVGDEPAIAAIFHRREQEREALGAVVSVFNSVLPSLRGAAAADAIREQLESVVRRNPAVPCRAALDAVETYRKAAAGAGADEIDRSLRTYAAFVAREHELAEKHSHRKTQ